MLLDISYYGHYEVIEEETLVIAVKNKIEEIMAEKRARMITPNVDYSYKKLIKEGKISLFNL